MAMQSSVNFDFSDIPRSGTFIHGSDETIGGLHERNRHDFRIEVMRLPPPSLKFLRISRSFKRSYDDANRWFSILKKKKKKKRLIELNYSALDDPARQACHEEIPDCRVMSLFFFLFMHYTLPIGTTIRKLYPRTTRFGST